MTKKIILIMVEGPTDEDALALIYSKLVMRNSMWKGLIEKRGILSCGMAIH